MLVAAKYAIRQTGDGGRCEALPDLAINYTIDHT